MHILRLCQKHLQNFEMIGTGLKIYQVQNVKESVKQSSDYNPKVICTSIEHLKEACQFQIDLGKIVKVVPTGYLLNRFLML